MAAWIATSWAEEVPLALGLSPRKPRVLDTNVLCVVPPARANGALSMVGERV
jgi:hypothetical protein